MPGAAPMAAPGAFGMGPAPGAGPMGMAGPKGTARNPVTTLLFGMICPIYALIALWGMLTELQAFTRDEEFKPWYFLIPILGIYFMLVKVPEQVTKAKQMAGSRNPQAAGFILYFFLGLYALAKDMNEVWDPNAVS
jgi:hypothetical protein